MENEVPENPTPAEGASIQVRLERYLAAEEAPPQQPAPDEPDEERQAADPAEETDADEPEQASETQLTTAELARYLGLEDDVFEPEGDDLYIKTKIDGQEGRAKFADVLKSYQLQGHLDNKSREFAEQQKAFQAHAEQYQQAVSQRMQQAEDVASIAYQALMNESQSINWNELAQNDPAEYIAKQHEFNARKTQIDQALAYVQHERSQAQQQTTQQYQNYLAQQAQRLPELIPEWKNPETAKAEMAELKTWGQKAGLSAEELNTVSNSVHCSRQNPIWKTRSAPPPSSSKPVSRKRSAVGKRPCATLRQPSANQAARLEYASTCLPPAKFKRKSSWHNPQIPLAPTTP
jgi:hypothetical protein